MKPAGRQAALLKHKTRDFLVRQRTQLVNTIRAHLSEFGPSGPWLGRNAPPERFMRAGPHPSSSVVAKGIHNVDRLLEAARDLPEAARPAVDMLANQLRETQEKIDDLTARIEAAQKAGPARPTPGDDPRDRRGDGECDRRVVPEARLRRDARGRQLPLGTGLRRLARAHAAAAFERRERAVGPDLQGRQPFRGLTRPHWGHGPPSPAPAALPWRDGADQRTAVPPTRRRLAFAIVLAPMAHNGSPHAGEKAGEGRRAANVTRTIGVPLAAPGEPHGAGRPGVRHRSRTHGDTMAHSEAVKATGPTRPDRTRRPLPAGNETVRRVTPKACLRHDVR